MINSVVKAMRPKQWAKNIFIFAGLVFDRQLADLSAFLHVAAAFMLFSLLASAVYIVNDLGDIDADRQHPQKKKRPIASGKVPVWLAWIISLSILMVVLPFSWWLSPTFAGMCVLYILLNLIYSKWIKHIVLLDVLLLASFYVIRVVVGVTVIEIERFSPWLYQSTIFLALFMGIGKRRAELVIARASGNQHRKVLNAYTLPFLDQLVTIVLTVTIMSYSLYTFSAPNLPKNNSMMLTIPFVIYGIFRYLYLVQVEGHGEAPEEIVLTDKAFIINIALWAATLLLIFYYL